jgi:hypothetical protein
MSSSAVVAIYEARQGQPTKGPALSGALFEGI